MNYIKQLNAFWRRRPLNPIPSAAADLYFTLLNFANISGWKEQFNVPNQMLMASCGVGRSELYRHRNCLISAGYIRYVNGRKGKAGKYSIVPLYDDTNHSIDPICRTDNEPTNEANDINPIYRTDDRTNHRTNTGTNTGTNNRTNLRTIHKLNLNQDLKQESSSSSEDDDEWSGLNKSDCAFLKKRSRDVFGDASPAVERNRLELMESWVYCYGMDMVKNALDVTVTSEGRTINYTAKVLKDWKGRGYEDGSEYYEDNLRREGILL